MILQPDLGTGLSNFLLHTGRCICCRYVFKLSKVSFDSEIPFYYTSIYNIGVDNIDTELLVIQVRKWQSLSGMDCVDIP